MTRLSLLLSLTLVAACVSVKYQSAGRQIAPETGKTLLVGRVRFFHDGREFFPWNRSLFSTSVGTDTERHLWLLRPGHRAVSAELHPDPDGSLAIWLAPGDYALVGSTRLPTVGGNPDELVALFRIPAGAVTLYAGDLSFTTERHEGGHFARGEFGEATVALAPPDSARVILERRFGALTAPPVVSAWCAGASLPAFQDRDLATHAKELLDRNCAGGG